MWEVVLCVKKDLTDLLMFVDVAERREALAAVDLHLDLHLQMHKPLSMYALLAHNLI